MKRQIAVRIEVEELKRIKERATQVRRTLSDYIRLVLADAQTQEVPKKVIKRNV